VFTGKLRHAKWRGTVAYGALATGEGGQFERKWLNRVGGIDASVLAVPRLLGHHRPLPGRRQRVCHGHHPNDFRNLLFLMIATLLPFLPVALMAVPLDVLLTKLAGLLL